MAVWTRHVEGGPRRVNHAAVCIGEYIYSFGGYCTGDNFDIRRDIDIHRFDTVTLTWSAIKYTGNAEDIPYQRYGHTVVAYDGSCILYGGRNDINGVSEHVYKFDVANRSWSIPEVDGELPLARDGHSCTVIGHCMYLFGGYEEESMAFANTVYALDLRMYRWTRCKSQGAIPPWRDFHSASTWRHYMVVYGGRSDESGPYHSNREIYDDSVYLYDSIEQVWSRPEVNGDIPCGRRSHCAFEYGGKVYIFGGYNGKLGSHYNDTHVYDPETHTWTLCRPDGICMPRIRRRACCCRIGRHVYIFGGTSPDIKQKRDEQESLVDLSDLHILELAASLRSLCMIAIIKQNIQKKDYENVLPKILVHELQAITQENIPARPPNG